MGNRAVHPPREELEMKRPGKRALYTQSSRLIALGGSTISSNVSLQTNYETNTKRPVITQTLLQINRYFRQMSHIDKYMQNSQCKVLTNFNRL